MKKLSVLLVALTAILLFACSHMNVKHLNRQPWSLETDSSLDMKFWEFNYRVLPETDHFNVTGTAIPQQDAIPEWASSIKDIWFAAYLSDKRGRVLAQDLRVYEPQMLNPATGIPFKFVLKPDSLGATGELFITFGYRMKLSEQASTVDESQPAQVFFASEGAMTRY